MPKTPNKTRKKTGRRFFVAALIISASVAPAMFVQAWAAPSPVGLWRSYDDHTGQPSALIRVFEQNGILHGRVEKVLVAADQGRLCDRCTDDRRNQPVLGMEIFRDLRPDGDGWAGHILDPQNGSIYTCTAHLADDGRQLVLRGYLLITLIGRSQTWQRVETPAP